MKASVIAELGEYIQDKPMPMPLAECYTDPGDVQTQEIYAILGDFALTKLAEQPDLDRVSVVLKVPGFRYPIGTSFDIRTTLIT